MLVKIGNRWISKEELFKKCFCTDIYPNHKDDMCPYCLVNIEEKWYWRKTIELLEINQFWERIDMDYLDLGTNKAKIFNHSTNKEKRKELKNKEQTETIEWVEENKEKEEEEIKLMDIYGTN